MKALRRHQKAGRSAYILMEVMLATGIFAMVAVALAVALNETISAAVRIQKETRITWGLESKLNEAKLKRLEVGKQTSPPDVGGTVYVTEVTLLDLKNEKQQPLTGMYNIKITAQWKEQNRNEEQVSQTYVYQP